MDKERKKGKKEYKSNNNTHKIGSTKPTRAETNEDTGSKKIFGTAMEQIVQGQT